MEKLETQLTPQREAFARADSWALREVLREHPATPTRQLACGVGRYQKRVELLSNGESCAWWQGVIMCRTKACPTCFVSRRHKLAAELDWTVCERERATREQSWLATLTIRHQQGDPVTICRAVRASWRKLQQSRRFYAWRKDRQLEYICAEEVTHGANGWHPHLHVLLMPGRGIDPFHRPYSYENVMFADWQRTVRKVIGPEAEPDHAHGLDLMPCDSAKYLAKLGLELSDPGVVKGSSPLRLLMAGQVERYIELQQSRRRARDITFSRGLKAIREAQQPSPEAFPVAELSGQGWAILRAMGWKKPLDIAEASTDPEAAELALRAALGCLYEQATEQRNQEHDYAEREDRAREALQAGDLRHRSERGVVHAPSSASAGL